MNIPKRPIGGGKQKYREPENREFYSFTSDEITMYVDNDEN